MPWEVIVSSLWWIRPWRKPWWEKDFLRSSSMTLLHRSLVSTMGRVSASMALWVCYKTCDLAQISLVFFSCWLMKWSGHVLFLGAVSLAGADSGLWAVDGGNKKVCSGLLYNSKSELIPARVTSISVKVRPSKRGTVHIPSCHIDLAFFSFTFWFFIFYPDIPSCPTFRHPCQFLRD